MNTHAYERVWQESTAKNGPRLVHLCLGRYANDRNVSYPGNETLEGETRLSLRAVQDGLRKLVDIGEIAELEGLSEYSTRKWQLFPRDGDADSSQIARDLHPSSSSSSTSNGGSDLGAESAPPTAESAPELGEPDLIAQVRLKLIDALHARGIGARLHPSREAIAKIIEDYPDKDVLKIADDFAFWAVHGRGQMREIKSPAGTFRNFVKIAEVMAPVEDRDRRSAYDRVEN